MKERANRNKSFLSSGQGKDSSLTSVRKNGNLYLGYKNSNSWYYTKLSRNISSLTSESSKSELPDKFDKFLPYF